MAKRHYSSKRSMSMERSDHIEPANRGKGSIFREDFLEPCGLPYGAHQIETEPTMKMRQAGGATDLYYRVSETMRQDSEDMDSLTKPTNW